jgi:hypothetical protein
VSEATRSDELARPCAVLARFDSESAAVAAARTLLREGYGDLDALAPRPIVALERLLAPRRSRLPWLALAAGLVGAMSAVVGQWYCNGWDYPINVGGRPLLSVPAYIPIAFELMVLFAALTTFVGVLGQMGLPRLAHPVFQAPGIESASVDAIWLVVGTHDSNRDPARVVERLRALDGSTVVEVFAPTSDGGGGQP